MANFIGNTASTATGIAYKNPAYIVSFSLANKTGGSITASVGLLQGSTFYIIYNKSINTADSYIYSGEQILVPIGYQIFVSVSGSCDYIFNIQ